MKVAENDYFSPISQSKASLEERNLLGVRIQDEKSPKPFLHCGGQGLPHNLGLRDGFGFVAPESGGAGKKKGRVFTPCPSVIPRRGARVALQQSPILWTDKK